MNYPVSPNRDTLIAVARQLSPLLPEVVFVGGQVAELLITDPAATRVRPTRDVDVVVAAASRLEYRRIEERLTELGLTHDTSEDAPMCRWRARSGHLVDVMSQDEAVLGFSNRWYALALQRSVEHELEEGLTIRIPTAPIYIATKWDAFLNRGNADYLRSHDLEDIIAVVAGRPELLHEVREETEPLQQWLSDQIATFLLEETSTYALEGALPDASQIPELLTDVRSRFETLVI